MEEVLKREYKWAKKIAKSCAVILLITFAIAIPMLLSTKNEENMCLLCISFAIAVGSLAFFLDNINKIRKLKHLLHKRVEITKLPYEIEKIMGEWFVKVKYEGTNGQCYVLKEHLIDPLEASFCKYIDLVVDPEKPKKYFFISFDNEYSHSIDSRREYSNERIGKFDFNKFKEKINIFPKSFDKYSWHFKLRALIFWLIYVGILARCIATLIDISYIFNWTLRGVIESTLYIACALFLAMFLLPLFLFYLTTGNGKHYFKSLRKTYMKTFELDKLIDRSKAERLIMKHQISNMSRNSRVYINVAAQIYESIMLYDFSYRIRHNRNSWLLEKIFPTSNSLSSKMITFLPYLDEWYILFEMNSIGKMKEIGTANIIGKDMQILGTARRATKETLNGYTGKESKKKLCSDEMDKCFDDFFDVTRAKIILPEDLKEKLTNLKKAYDIDFTITINPDKTSILIKRKEWLKKICWNASNEEFEKVKKYFSDELKLICEIKSAFDE